MTARTYALVPSSRSTVKKSVSHAAFGSSILNGNEPRDLGSVVLTGPDS